MSVDDVEAYEAEQELALYREYRDVLPMFRYVIETDKRTYLANEVEIVTHEGDADTYVELTLSDAWVWDMHRTSRFVTKVRIVTFHDIAIEERRPEDSGPHIPPAGKSG